MQSRLPNTPQAPDTILITGGAQRLGRYCAERLIDDGHPVIISYRREREELVEDGPVEVALFGDGRRDWEALRSFA